MHDDEAAHCPDEIVAESIRAVGAIYMAWQLEELRLFDVVDRLVERFAQGMLPIRDSSSAGVLERYYRDRHERLARHERFALYGHVLGVPQADSASVAANRAFNELWLAFLATVTDFDRQQRATSPSESPSLTSEHLRLAGRRLATNATAAVSQATPHAARRLVDETWQALEILKTREILSAYGVQSHWALIDRVAASDLAATVPDIARHRTMAEAGEAILDLVATDVAWWSDDHHPLATAPSKYRELVRNVERWLAAAGSPVT